MDIYEQFDNNIMPLLIKFIEDRDDPKYKETENLDVILDIFKRSSNPYYYSNNDLKAKIIKSLIDPYDELDFDELIAEFIIITSDGNERLIEKIIYKHNSNRVTVDFNVEEKC